MTAPEDTEKKARKQQIEKVPMRDLVRSIRKDLGEKLKQTPGAAPSSRPKKK